MNLIQWKVKMRAWLARLKWWAKGTREVRLQLVNNQGAIDGILLTLKKGHYVLASAFYYEQKPDAQGLELLGQTWVQKERVQLMQVKKP